MADFSALKTSIQNYIKQNGNEEITGNLLQQILLSMVTTLGDSAINDLVTALNNEVSVRQNADGTLQTNINNEATARGNADTELDGRITTLQGVVNGIVANVENGYVYAGIATPSTIPVSGKVFYLALTAGTYTNFGAAVVPQGINILKYNGSAWSLDSFLGLDDAPTQGSSNLVKSGGVLDSIIKDGSAFDLSAYNSGTTYADLSAALTALNALPAAYKKGGMSVKFVQTSDNKYVQYRLMSDSWSIDTNDWSFCGNDVLVDNPEFVYVKTDSEDKILFGIKVDGDIYFGVGVPTQVKEYIQNKISELSLDEYEDIVAFLNGLEEGDKTLQTLLNEKVDKEEGKSLIDVEYASSQSAIDNPEYLQVTIDNNDKILEGIKPDGTKVIGGDIKVLGNMEVSGVSYKVIENPEYLAAWVDAEDQIIFGLKADGKTYVGDADFLNDIDDIKAFLQNVTDKNIDWDALSSIAAIENPEFIEAKTDSDGKLLAGRTPDGAAFENVGFSAPKVSIDGHIIENIEDPEGRSEITTDSDGKIISYRDADGAKHEEVGFNSKEVSTDSLKLSDKGMTEFQQALKNAGFNPGYAGDWSEKEVIELPEPIHYAILNLTIESLPTTSGDVREAFAQYYDGMGNYFKLNANIEIQGQSSRIFASTGGKGNYTIDLPKDIKFGSWVPQDSFHLKGCAKDVTRGMLATSYKFAWEVMKYLDAKPNRVLLKEDQIGVLNATGDRFTDWPSDARCLPDGFPIELYINGEYWGLYALQLKKHRKNYSMNKKDYTSCFIDADDLTGFWTGNIPWTKFDIKGPKDLVCMDGSDFDGDAPKELIDSTSSAYNPTNKAHRGSAQTKAIIQSWSTKYQEVKNLVDANTTESLAQAKELFAEYFDIDGCIMVYIFNCTMGNSDSILKNTLWGTYNNGKIVPMLWDLDAMYGHNWIGITVNPPSADLWDGSYATVSWPLALLWSLYQDEIKSTYAELRRNGIISIDTWKSVMYDQWIKRIGVEAFERDIEKWPETPSYRSSNTNTEYWQLYNVVSNTLIYPEWDENTNYHTGEYASLNMGSPSMFAVYKALNDNINQCPVTKFYNSFPTVGGFYDSPKRMEKWMNIQISLCDAKMNYNQN